MKRFAVLTYGIIAYLVFLGTFGYLIGFVGNLVVPKSIDGALEVPLWQALLTNIGLIFLFGLQHSMMARAGFKKWWTQFVPKAMERSTYMIFTGLALVTLYYFWQPLGSNMVWQIDQPIIAGVLLTLFALGWLIVLASSYLINHFDLFGLRQVWLYFRGKPYTELPFGTPVFYKYVRHPLYFGILLAFWATPEMSVTRLVFALVFTIYTLRAIRWEEKDLLTHFGERYRRYAEKVPMILPRLSARSEEEHTYDTIMKGE